MLFIAFSGEEEGLLGSQLLARNFDPKAVTAMVNMDMIGRPDGVKNPIITGDDRSNLITIFNKKLYALAPQYGKMYFQGDRYSLENLFIRSDNYPFAQRGIIAHTSHCPGLHWPGRWVR